MRKWLVAALAAVVLLALVGLGLRWWQDRDRSDLQRAVDLAPQGAQRLTFTDWADVRRTLGADLAADTPTAEVEAFLGEAFEADLSPMSALLESTPDLHRSFGFSPATLEWEMLSQSPEGAVVVMQLPGSTDFDALQDGFAELGYERPASETGVWNGGIDLLPSIGGTLTPELQFLAVDADQRLVVSSDTGDYLAQAMRTITRDAGSVEGLDEVVAATGDPLAAAVYAGDEACRALAMGTADAADQDQGDELVAAAGEVDPLTGFVMAAEPDRGVRVAMSFDDEDEARTNADSRSTLASGPAPGQGGDFADRFALGDVVAQGAVVTMDLAPGEGEYLLSDLTSGPVLFATC